MNACLIINDVDISGVKVVHVFENPDDGSLCIEDAADGYIIGTVTNDELHDDMEAQIATVKQFLDDRDFRVSHETAMILLPDLAQYECD